MKIAVIGAGIVGITCAYELARDGHQVSVFERNAAIAEEASFANGGLQALSLSHPLAHTPWPMGSWMRRVTATSAIALTRSTSLRDLRWLIGWKVSPDQAIFLERFALMNQLVQFSLQRQNAISHDETLHFEQAQGQLVLVPTAAALQAMQPQLDALKSAGLTCITLNAEQARALEPGLDRHFEFHAALHFPQDGVANCRQFAHLLKDKAVDLGVTFHFGARVVGLAATPKPELTLLDRSGALPFDHIVVCTGTGDTLLGLGKERLPLTPVVSCSISVPVRESLNAPRGAVLDYRSGISMARIGSRIRVSGAAALRGVPGTTPENASRPLFQTLQTSFPGAASFHHGTQIWSGRSAFTPDSLPLLGVTTTAGIWLNLGHGYNGWGMACGCARLIADQIDQRTPQNESYPDCSALSPARFHH